MENLTVLDSLEQWPVSIALASFSFDRLERQKILKMSQKDLVRQLPLAITPNGTLSHAPDHASCTKTWSATGARPGPLRWLSDDNVCMYQKRLNSFQNKFLDNCPF